MRLQEFTSEEEWQRFEQLIYANRWKALSTQQQQTATQQRLESKPAATLNPKAAKTAKALVRKAKRTPHAAPSLPLPKAQQVSQARAEATPAYCPGKTVEPQPPDMDQEARRMLRQNNRGQNPIHLLAPQ